MGIIVHLRSFALSHPEATLNFPLRSGRIVVTPALRESTMTRPVPRYLHRLARAAIRQDQPVGLAENTVVALTLSRGEPDWTQVHGVRCGPEVRAIAFPFGWCVEFDMPLALAIDRRDTAIVVDPHRPDALFVDEPESLLLDAARRVLGLPTPPPDTTPLHLNDMVWLHRILELTLDSPLGEPPPWPLLACLHPLSNGNHTPEGLRHRRKALHTDWHSVHRLAQTTGVDWVPLTPAGAAWFDLGSFSRWLLAALPDSATMLQELGELLRPSDYTRVASTLALSER